MRTRLWKDLRRLLPLAVIGGGLGVAAIYLSPEKTFLSTLAVLYIVANALGVFVFGTEHANNRMAILLAQPLTRARIWWEKVLVLAILLSVLVGVASVAGPALEFVRVRAAWGKEPWGAMRERDRKTARRENLWEVATQHHGPVMGTAIASTAGWALRYIGFPPVRDWEKRGVIVSPRGGFDREGVPHPWDWTVSSLFQGIACASTLLVVAALVGFGGLWMGLTIRQPHTAFGASVVLPVAAILVWLGLAALLHRFCGLDGLDGRDEAWKETFLIFVGFFGIPWTGLAVVSLIASRIQIQRMEV